MQSVPDPSTGQAPAPIVLMPMSAADLFRTAVPEPAVAKPDPDAAAGVLPAGATDVFVDDGAADDAVMDAPRGGPLSSEPPRVDVTLTLDVAGTGAGTVTSSPAGLVTCTGWAQTCLGTFATGTVVTLSATAASGHQFLGWRGACTGTSTCTVTMSDARYVAAQFRLVVPTVVTRYYHVDALGSVRAVTNADGSTARRDDYLVFGEGGTPPMGGSIRFTGKERDAETALDYFGARYYRNLMGRFTTVDPLFDVETAMIDPQHWNRYSYVLNRPLLFVDPDGRNPVLFWIVQTAQRLASSPAAQRAQRVVTEQGARVWVALTRLFNTSQGQQLVQTGAELATGGDLGPSFGHGARHLEGLKVSAASVQAAIVAQIQNMAKTSKLAGSFWGHVTVDGVTIRYRAFVQADGSIHVGTYYPLE